MSPMDPQRMQAVWEVWLGVRWTLLWAVILAAVTIRAFGFGWEDLRAPMVFGVLGGCAVLAGMIMLGRRAKRT
jgi:hypothetical protein